ncbi:MAG: helix-turn-helix transcriptional regulator [Steroidobacteraceae bacterium]
MTEYTTAARLLISARRSSGLTQRDLARRARTSQSVIARIESGAVSPSWKTLQRLVKRAGFNLQGILSPSPPGLSHMLDDVPRILRLTPEQRLLELHHAARFFAAAVRVDAGTV